ncbi:MAG TPA: hypothetical protein VIQ51_11620 [Chryseosolibacter sp.]
MKETAVEKAIVIPANSGFNNDIRESIPLRIPVNNMLLQSATPRRFNSIDQAMLMIERNISSKPTRKEGNFFDRLNFQAG